MWGIWQRTPARPLPYNTFFDGFSSFERLLIANLPQLRGGAVWVVTRTGEGRLTLRL